MVFGVLFGFRRSDIRSSDHFPFKLSSQLISHLENKNINSEKHNLFSVPVAVGQNIKAEKD
jgi:hypothetical protein